MTELVFVVNGQAVTDSLAVAEVFNKEHRRVMQDIRDLGCSEDFRLHHFVQSSYQNQQGREMPKVVLTEQGFTLLVMGYTGENAMRFKETYIAEFDRMRKTLQTSVPNVVALDERKVRLELLKTAIDHEGRIEQVEERITSVERKVDEQITLDHGEQRKIQKAVAIRVYELTDDMRRRRELFRELYREIKDRWAVPSYRDVRRTELGEVLKYAGAWKPKAVAI